MSPFNEDASVAQWYGLRTLNPRTCKLQFVIACCSGLAFFYFFQFAISAGVWQAAKPRTALYFHFDHCHVMYNL
jgi:hypothetical protein